MSKPNRYDTAFGVLPLEWKVGAPPNDAYGLVLVEVWSASTDITYSPATKPWLGINARLEVRFRVNNEWRAVRQYDGALDTPSAGEVRRHALLFRARHWNTTITLDGWN